MQNFQIKNKADVSIVEIFGGIGEDFFGEGITAKSINDQLKEIKSPQIELRVSSLGGNVFDALTIHDIIKMHPAKVTTKIIGATASSGTIIALAGDEIQMSENSLFLIHAPFVMTVGNSDELREAADDLDTVGDRIIDIYQKKTGKRKSQIKSLMKDEKWIDSDEAKNFGFIDSIFKPLQAAASITEDKKTEILNKIKEQEIKNKKEMDLKQEVQNLKDWAVDQFKLKDKPGDFETVVNNKIVEFENKITEVENLQTEVKDLSEKAAGFEAEKETIIGERDDFKGKFETLEVSNKTLQSEFNALKAEKSEVKAEDPNLGEPEKASELGESIVAMFSDTQKNSLKNIKKD